MNKTNDMNDIVVELSKLHLSTDEAKIYLELLREPNTHLQLSHATGINRTKVYRLVEDLEKKSLIYRRTDDRGTFLVASDPSALEVGLIAQEQELVQQRQTFQHLAPLLSQLQGKDSRAFVIRTYEGEAGLKQMCWHELKTKGEILALGNGTIEQLVNDNAWAEKHRDRQIVAGYTSRELINWNYNSEEIPDRASQRLLAANVYDYRLLPFSVITFDNQTTIYNDTVAIYHWKYGQKVGVEIISATYAQMMRQIFEAYWRIGKAE